MSEREELIEKWKYHKDWQSELESMITGSTPAQKRTLRKMIRERKKMVKRTAKLLEKV